MLCAEWLAEHQFRNYVEDGDTILPLQRAYEQVLREAKDTSIQEMIQRAQAMGANAIVGIDIDYETIGANGSMLMVAS